MIVAATTRGGITLVLHQGFARAFLFYSVILAIWAFYLWLRGSNPSGGFLGALVIMEGLAIVQGLVGIVLRIQGHQPHDALHFLYGLAAVLTIPTAYFMSEHGTTRRDSMVFGLAGFFLLGVGLRSAATGGS